jgi:hypothetical protein
MRLIKLIVPAVLIAVLALFAPHADAQTTGEYGAATAGVGTSGGSMGTSIAPTSFGSNDITSNDIGGGSSTWGASGLGASFEERARRASASGLNADFESRAGSSANRWNGDSRWPGSAFTADTSNRFGASSNRFPERGELSSSNRFPATALSGNRTGVDTNYNALNNY